MLDANGETVLDQFTYSSKWQNPILISVADVSLEKINPALPVQSQSSWHSAASSVNYGTPGYKNSQYRALEQGNSANKVWLEKDYFSPNNDGADDVLLIHFAAELVGTSANIQIFNSVGEKIRQLSNNILLPPEGFISWDGVADNGKIANAGVYILYFQFFNNTNSTKNIIKLPVVLTNR